ncbi:par-3 family cell polarity regulator [Phyllostomus discolor]|uniref:Par-3 family cell polarity regulator n=1 Tax=Phyllostomus discolor TaxID=89673 RepID=A0A834BMW0_9CHIR|nr:par-3 family cell polarity regulator [Phyllostomus discolor]
MRASELPSTSLTIDPQQTMTMKAWRHWKKTQKKAQDRGESPCPQPVTSLHILWIDK